MREYKFKGKAKVTGELVYGWYAKCFRPFHADADVIITEKGETIEVEPDTVGQYIGLHDKNGKEIYEGDILEEEPGYYFEVVWLAEWAKFKLEWRTKAVQYPEWNRGVNMTVIGNRWDNPELLKEVE